MRLREARNRIQELLAKFVTSIDIGSRSGRTDLNKDAETILIPLLNEVYGWSLINLNSEKNNYPGIDLADEVAGISIQVTATPTLHKVKETLKQFIKNNQYLKYSRLIIFILRDKEEPYSNKSIQSIIQNKFCFDPQEDILNHHDIFKKILEFEITKTLRVQEILEAYLGDNKRVSEKALRYSSRSLTCLPILPSHLLGRSTEFNALKNILFNSSTSGITESALKIGIYGMGGIGKSTLAGMLARDEEVQAAFPDRVFWISLGQEPILTREQLNFAQMLGDASLPFQDVQQGKIHLSQLLDNRQYLLILDDVWQVEHIAAFDVLSEQGKLLFTTRDIRIVKALNAIEYQVNLLSNDEALVLLATCSGQAKETLPAEAYKVMHECGNLPLAISMIGAIAKARPNRWDNLLHKLQNADLDKIRHQFPDYPYPDLLKAIQVSVDALEPEVRIRYLDFAVFPEDVAIPEATLRTFWEPEGLNEYDTQDVIDTLVERSLARRGEADNLTLHDLQYDYVRKQNANLPALHSRLLNAYAAHCPQGWHTYPQNDGYFFENLAYHLKASGRKDELYVLLTKSPQWMETKFVKCMGDSSYVADLELALRDFSDPLNSSQVLDLAQLHAARRVVDERISQYDKEDLEVLVWLGREAEALSHGRLTLEPVQRFVKLLTIYDALQQQGKIADSLLNEIWQTAQLTKNNCHEPIRTWALGNVAVRLHLCERQEEATLALAEAEDTLSELNSDWLRYTPVFLNIADGTIDNSSKDKTETLTREWLRAEAFEHFATALFKCGNSDKAICMFKRAKQIAIQVNDEQLHIGSYKTQAHVFEELAIAMIRANFIEEAQTVIQLIKDDYHLVNAYWELALALGQIEKHQVEIESVVGEVSNTITRVEEEHISKTELNQLILALIQSNNKFTKPKISKLANTLKQTQFFKFFKEEWKTAQVVVAFVEAQALIDNFITAVEAVQNIKHCHYQSLALKKLVQLMVKANYTGTEQLIRRINSKSLQVEALREFSLALSQSGNIDQASKIFSEVRDFFTQSYIEENCHSEAEMLHKLVLALITAQYLYKAEQFIELITNKMYRWDWYQSDALIDLASAVAKFGDMEKALELFLKAEKTIQTIKISLDQVTLYRKLESALLKTGCLKQLSYIREKAEEASQQAIYVRVLTDGRISSIQGKESEKLVKELIRNQYFVQAFNQVSIRELYSFLSLLADESHTFEQMEESLSIKILRELLRISSWVRPDWEGMYNLIFSF